MAVRITPDARLPYAVANAMAKIEIVTLDPDTRKDHDLTIFPRTGVRRPIEFAVHRLESKQRAHGDPQPAYPLACRHPPLEYCDS